MNLAFIIATYGYPAIFLGSFFEGEATLILGGLAVHQGILLLPWVLFIAFMGAILGDMVWFALGKYKGEAVLKKCPRIRKMMNRSRSFIHKKPWLISLFFRFLYGFKIIIPFTLGMSGMRTKTFVIYNALGAFLWTVVVGIAGYLFGDIVESILGKMRHYEFKIIIIVVLVLSVTHIAMSLFKLIVKKYTEDEVEGM